MQADSVKVTELRKYRRRIKHLVALVSGGERIREKPGEWWCANLETREIEWVYCWPFEPFTKVDDEGIRYCVAHEGSHIRWSGLYETKRIPDHLKSQFHRLVNGVEDVRVDRLSTREYGAFRDAQLHVRRMLRNRNGRTNPEGWSLPDAVGLNACNAFEIGMEPEGSDLAVEASKRLWPKLSRIANLRSTQEVATALEPIFLALLKVEQLDEQRKEQEAEQERREQERQQREEAERQQAEAEQGERDEKEGRKEQSGDVGPPEPQQAEPGQGQPQAGEQSGAEPGESGGKPGDSGTESEKNSESGGGEGGESVREPGATQEGAGGSGEPAQGEPQPGASGSSTSEVGKQEAGPKSEPSSGVGGSGSNRTVPGELPPPEPEPEPIDPLKPLENIRAQGANQPTDQPVKSEGEKGTEPIPLGRELDGMEQDATDPWTQRELREAASGNDRQRQQNAAMRDMQLGKRQPPTPAGLDRWEQRRRDASGRINSLSNRIKAVLRQNSMEHSSTGHRRGKLDIGKVHRLKTGSVRVFRQPGTIGGLDYTFGLLVDTSGSMFSVRPEKLVQGRTEADWSFDATVLVAEALERAGLGHFVILWDVVMPHVKPVDEPLVPHRGSLGEILGRSKGGEKTIESPALARALDEMEKIKVGRKMLIVITDGGCSTKAESKELLGELAEQHVQALTIRIGGEPADHYEHGYSVAHADELVQLLPRLINSVVRRTSG